MARKRGNPKTQGTAQTRWARLAGMTEAAILVLSVAFGAMTPACVAAQDSLPGFRVVAPEDYPTAEDFRQHMRESAKSTTTAETLANSVSMSLLSMEAGTALDAEIEELARGLKYDPGLMYSFVHDHIQFYPMWGDVKGAAMTLMDRSGDAFDHASLMIALLTKAAGAAGAPHTITDIKYVAGQIEVTGTQITNWFDIPNVATVASQVIGSSGIYATVNYDAGDGTINYVRMDHIWVKATIDGQVYEFDPSFKTHSIKTGLTEAQLESAMGYTRNAFVTSAQQGYSSGSDWVKDLNRTNITSALTNHSTNLINYIKTNCPAGDLADIIGGKTIIPVAESALPPSSLPYTVLSVAREFTASTIPGEYRTTVQIQHLGINVIRNSSEIYGRRLVIEYNAGRYPELRLDGTLLQAGTTQTTFGNSYPLTVIIDHPYWSTFADQTGSLQIVAGGFWHIVNGWGCMGTKSLNLHRKILQQYRHDGYTDDSEEVRGETFTLLGLTWGAERTRTYALVEQTSRCHNINHHGLGIAGQYLAPHIDLPLCMASVIQHNGSSTDRMATVLATSGQMFAGEHGVIEQLQDTRAISTIKLLDMANSRTTEDKIFSTSTTQGNWTSVQSQLSGYDPSTEISHVTPYITGGYTVSLPEYGNLNEADWTGIGFMAAKVVGDDIVVSYIISGGYKGSDSSDNRPFSVPEGYFNWTAQMEATEPGGRELRPYGSDPVDLLSGAFVYDHTDLAVGNGGFPLGLQLDREYNSDLRLEDGPFGLGWTHAYDITAEVASSSFQATGDDSAIDAAANIVSLYVTFDLFRSPSLARNVICSICEKWLMDQMTDNIVLVKRGSRIMSFVKLPDGSFNPPPGRAVKLIKEVDNTYLLKDNAGNFLDFDSNNRAVRWSDPHGNAVDFAYANDKLSSVTSKVGGTTASRSLTFTYDVNHIDTVTDSAGRSVSFDYDAVGNLVSYTDPEQYETTFGYDASDDGLLTQVFYPDRPMDPYVTNVYDSLGRVEQQTNASGQITDIYYSYYRTEELEPSQTPPSGPASRYSKVYYFDDLGNTVATKDQLGRTTTTEYDGHQRPKKVTSPAGNYVQYAYDQYHNVIQTTQVHAPGFSEPNIVISAVYDTHESTAGRWFVNLQQATDAAGNTTTYTYDYEMAAGDVGNLRTVTYPQVPIPGSTATPTVQYTYNSYGQVLTEVNPESVTTSYEYYTAAEGAGLKKTIVDSGAGHLNLTTEVTYDSVGNVVTTKDPRNNITQTEYDDRRLPVRTVSPEPFNYETTYDYYEDGKVRQVRTLPKTEGATIQAPDLVGTNHGVISGVPRWVDGIAGLALQCDASGGHAIIPDADALTPASTLSISFWANWKGSGRVGVYKYAPGADSRSYYVQVLEDGKVQCAIFEPGTASMRANSYDVLTTASAISANVWHHIVLVFNAGSATLYVDGNAGGSKTMCVTSICNDTQPLILGGYFSGTVNPVLAGPLSGAIDEVCIFNRPLSLAEIQDVLRDNGLKGISAIAGLAEANYPVAYWNLDQQLVTATSFYTYTPTGQKATVTGPMDDTIAHDSIQNYHGDVKGNVVWATGQVGTAISASSTAAGSVVIPDADALTPTSTMSLSFWLKWAGTQATGIYKYASQNGSRSYFVQVGTDSKIRFTVFSGATTSATLQSTTTIPLNTWQHVAVTFSAGAAKIYINGVLRGSTTMAVTSIMNDGQPLILGGFWSTLTQDFVPRFNGAFDELCLFSRAVSSTEVTQLYNNGNNGVSALTGFAAANYPVAYWNFDEAQVGYTQYTYDVLDRPWKVTDARGIVTETRYYPDGQVYRVIGDSGTGHLNRNTITNTYNTNGTLNTVADALNNTTTYTYDGHLRPKRTTYPNTTYEEVTYDNYGRVQQTRNRANQLISFTYDALNRVRTKTLPAPTAKTITYEYDRASRLINTIDTVVGTFTNGYDRANRLLSVTYPGSRVVSYQYDAAGNRTRLNYPFDSYYVTYTYDELNRLVNIKNPSSQVLAQYAYDALSRRRTLLYGNHTGSHYLYDGSSRLKSVETYMIGESFRYAYEYDNVGNRKSMLVNDTDLHSYSYDNMYWLTGTDHPAGFFTADTTFNYDNAGNRNSVVSGGTTNYTVNNLNQYSAVGGTGYTYDNNGNLLTDGSGKTYAYDALNHMISVSGGASATYTYGPEGKRRTRTTGGTTTTFYYDGMDVIAEAVGSTCSRKFVHGPGDNEPVCMIASGQTYYYHYDGLGSVVAVSLSGTNIPQKYVYNAYGQCQATGTDVGNPYRFTGYRLDTETGLYFAHARHYNPAIGRFLQADPSGYGDGINWYLYCGNNPIALADSWGLCRLPGTKGLTGGGYNYLSAVSGIMDGYGADVYGHYASIVTAPHDYYYSFRAAGLGPLGSGLQAANFTAGKVVGYSNIAEGVIGVDVRSVTELTTGGRVWRGVSGGVQTVTFVAATGGTLSALRGSSGEGTQLYRVFGDEAQGLGNYYTTVNPASLPNYREAAGLYPGNSGQFVLEGTLTNTEGVIFRTAAPGPAGMGGGLPEVFVPNPGTQIDITRVSGVNPPF